MIDYIFIVLLLTIEMIIYVVLMIKSERNKSIVIGNISNMKKLWSVQKNVQIYDALKKIVKPYLYVLFVNMNMKMREKQKDVKNITQKLKINIFHKLN